MQRMLTQRSSAPTRSSSAPTAPGAGPQAPIEGVMTRRRVLGDITNSFAGEESRENVTKKAATQAYSQQDAVQAVRMGMNVPEYVEYRQRQDAQREAIDMEIRAEQQAQAQRMALEEEEAAAAAASAAASAAAALSQRTTTRLPEILEPTPTMMMETLTPDRPPAPVTRPYMQRASDDIDARDGGNPVLVTAYVNEMYEHFNEQERSFRVNADYMNAQAHINANMRSILVDWLVEVHIKFKMVPETLFLTINIIDRYLEKKTVRRSKLQLVGVASLLLASKYEEIYPPELTELVQITDRAYNQREIVEMESEVVSTLQYNLTVPTIHTFICRYLKAAHADRTMVQLTCFLAERTLQEYSSLRFLPSVVAATTVMLARKSLDRHPWSPTLLQYTGLDESDLAECVQDMQRYFSVSASCEQRAVVRKYSGSKFNGVARTPIAF